MSQMTFKIVSDRKLEFRQNKTNKQKNNTKNKLNERLRSFIRADHILFSVFCLNSKSIFESDCSTRVEFCGTSIPACVRSVRFAFEMVTYYFAT